MPSHEENERPGVDEDDAHPDDVDKVDHADIDRISSVSSRHSISTVEDKDVEASEASKRPQSVRSETRAAVPVPRAERRGLLARFAIIPEVTQPIDYTNKTKWTITALVATAAAAAPAGSAIIMPALSEVAYDFNSNDTITNLSVALYMLSMAIFPLWWSSLSETLGRRTVYIASFTLFAVWGILAAVAQNIAMLIVMRILSGGAAASVQAVGAGTIADMWEPKERGKAMSTFYLGPLCGPLFAPIVGGALADALGWRSTQWFLVIYGGVMIVALILFLPETLTARAPLLPPTNPADNLSAQPTNEKRPSLQRTSTRQSALIASKNSARAVNKYLFSPLKIILYLQHPPILLTVLYASITFGTLYVLNISIETSFSDPPYDFSTTIVGLLYIPNSLGYVLAALLGGRWIDHIMHREAIKAGRYTPEGKLILRPEDRMRENAWLGAFLFPIGLLAYGWSVQFGVHWTVPMVANFFFGVGSMLIFALATTMLTEFLPRKASAGIALNNLVRNILSCTGAIIAEPVIGGIGNGWLFTIMGGVTIVAGPIIIIVMKRKGSQWSEEMKRALEKEK